MLDIRSESEDSVSSQAEAGALLREIVSPPAPGESVKALIGRAARHSGLTFTRARKLWYGEARSILAHELDHLRQTARARKAKQREEAKADEDRGWAELRDVIERLDRIERSLSSVIENRLRPMGDQTGAQGD